MMSEFDNLLKYPWSKKNDYDSLHSICSYLGSFPPSLARYFIEGFTKENEVVLDPFSGRGTTLLESRLLGRKALASDLNPIALALSRAKSTPLNYDNILGRIKELKDSYDSSLFIPEAKSQDDDILLIYNQRTLAELCYLRYELNTNNSIDNYLIGAVLGIMHGAEKKDGDSSYASISMPNTFSMSPAYVRRFVQVNQLNRVYRNVFQLLIDKTKRVFNRHNEVPTVGNVFECDAKKLSRHIELSKYLGLVDLVLTSPPYLGVVNYAKQNWIRSWFLNSYPDKIFEFLDDDLNIFEWITFSKKILEQIKQFLTPKGVAVFVIGDVAKSKDSVIPLAREFAFMVRENKLFKNIWVISDHIKGEKTTRIWGDTKGKATAIDRIVILSDINPFKNKHTIKYFSEMPYDEIIKSTNLFLGEGFCK